MNLKQYVFGKRCEPTNSEFNLWHKINCASSNKISGCKAQKLATSSKPYLLPEQNGCFVEQWVAIILSAYSGQCTNTTRAHANHQLGTSLVFSILKNYVNFDQLCQITLDWYFDYSLFKDYINWFK